VKSDRGNTPKSQRRGEKTASLLEKKDGALSQFSQKGERREYKGGKEKQRTKGGDYSFAAKRERKKEKCISSITNKKEVLRCTSLKEVPGK